MQLQIEPDALTQAYREDVLARLDVFIGVGVMGVGLVVFLLAVIAVRKL